MDALTATLALLSVSFYFIAAATVARSLGRRDAIPGARVQMLVVLALLLHGLVLSDMLWRPEGLHVGLFSIAGLHGALLALLALLVNLYRPVHGIYLIATPLAAIELSLGVAGHDPTPPMTAPTPGMELHILLSLLAYSVLSIAALQAILVHWQERALRVHRRGLLMALPALQTMERMLFELIALGFVLLSIAIATGAFLLDDLFAQHVAHKTVLTLMAWLVFAILLLGRHWRGWRGRTAVRFTLTGFVLLLIGFIGSKFVLELVLPRSL